MHAKFCDGSSVTATADGLCLKGLCQWAGVSRENSEEVNENVT